MKKTARNDVTGDFIQSKPSNDMFGEGWDRIFKKKKELPEYELNKTTGEVQQKETDNG